MIYLDYNATHPPIQSIIEKNLKAYYEQYANPSGISAFGQKNQSRIEECRTKVATLLSKESKEIINRSQIHFVSTATEGIYQIIKSLVATYGRTALVSPYEHDATYGALGDFQTEIHYLKANKSGRIDLDDFKMNLEKLTPNFVVCIAASNESGVIQPIDDVAEILRQKEIPLFSDTVQAVGKMHFDYSIPDFSLVNGHKIGAGFGAAAVIAKKRILPQFRGGLQEDEKRAGTENFPAIYNLADALEIQTDSLKGKLPRLAQFQKRIEDHLKMYCGAEIIASDSPRISNTTYALFPNIESMDFFLLALDKAQVSISTGSSCKSRTRQPSSMLVRMGYTQEEALQALRFSTGLFTSEQEIDTFLQRFQELIEKLN